MINEDIKKFRFRFSGKTLVIIDWANVYGWFADPKSKNYLGWEIDVKRLFDHLSMYANIIDKRLYQGIEVANERSERFGEQVKSLGLAVDSENNAKQAIHRRKKTPIWSKWWYWLIVTLVIIIILILLNL